MYREFVHDFNILSNFTHKPLTKVNIARISFFSFSTLLRDPSSPFKKSFTLGYVYIHSKTHSHVSFLLKQFSREWNIWFPLWSLPYLTLNSWVLFCIRMRDWSKSLVTLQRSWLGVRNHWRRALPHCLKCAESGFGRWSPDKYLQMAGCGEVCTSSPDGRAAKHRLGGVHGQTRRVLCLF